MSSNVKGRGNNKQKESFFKSLKKKKIIVYRLMHIVG